MTPVSLVIAALWLGEMPTATTIAGAAIATAGVALMKGGDAAIARLSTLRAPEAAVIPRDH